jgi:hypothetical protein
MLKINLDQQLIEIKKAIQELQDIVLVLANQLAELRKDVP